MIYNEHKEYMRNFISIVKEKFSFLVLSYSFNEPIIYEYNNYVNVLYRKNSLGIILTFENLEYPATCVFSYSTDNKIPNYKYMLYPQDFFAKLKFKLKDRFVQNYSELKGYIKLNTDIEFLANEVKQLPPDFLNNPYFPIDDIK